MDNGCDTQCKGVTIGIPLYNEENYIEEALRSAASQCGSVWVSDNASTDGSAETCERLIREYPNVTLLRQPHNMGAVANFKLLLDKAETPYFMWLGSHDSLPNGYISQLIKLLEDSPEAVLAFGASHHVDIAGSQTSNYDYYYSAALADKLPSTRVLGLIRHLSDCSLIHGLFRTEVLRSVWRYSGELTFIGSDHVLLTEAAIRGPFLYTPKTYLKRRDVHPKDSPHEQLKRMGLPQPECVRSSHSEMQSRQFTQVKTVSNGTGFSGLLFRLKARCYLVERFGPFGNRFMEKKLDLILKNNSQSILRWLQRIEKRFF